MSLPGKLDQPEIGDFVKVHLPGESPWAECVLIHSDGSWDGRIDNRLYSEMSEHEQARFMKTTFANTTRVSSKHSYKQNQIVTFHRERAPDYEIWIPATR